ncbi:uncharacterized protein LOC105436495 [Strongylocentrotus purpuratus]|uniref:Uncharacterized protein n=1 Tax=Strongylocentrotus purpuratus TaxID=7668 RepID=A0A7M7P2Z2_STRPU|nr:uncharacterized protein LOC105436495 [Strongylocentrotus purpuratus]
MNVIDPDVGPWARVRHQCLCRTQGGFGPRCKRDTRHLSRICWQHRLNYTEEEIEVLIRMRPIRCQAMTLRGHQCSRDGRRRHVLMYCTQHYNIHAGPEVMSDSDEF